MMSFRVAIPSLTDEGIQLCGAFSKVREVTSTSTIESFVITKMLIHLGSLFKERLTINREHRNLKAHDIKLIILMIRLFVSITMS